LNPLYRPLDDALAQVDAVFVQDHGPLRRHHRYATEPQREAMAAELKASS
jgi:hypothetical protein